jgi:hypothetical protein
LIEEAHLRTPRVVYPSDVFEDEPDRGPPVSLRGWLSDVYFPALLDENAESLEALAQRLGPRATIDDPIFGRCVGLPALTRFIAEMASWLRQHKATYTRLYFTTGTDRDVTEGALTLTSDEKSVELPVAVVAERRRSREVELRLYYSAQPIKGTFALRSPLVERNDTASLPSPIDEHLEALRKGDVAAVLASFEADGSRREARGIEQKKGAGLEETYRALLAGGGVEILKGGTADDGRTCALEYTLVKVRGKSVPPQAGLAVYERGDSGLLRALRNYDDLES